MRQYGTETLTSFKSGESPICSGAAVKASVENACLSELAPVVQLRSQLHVSFHVEVFFAKRHFSVGPKLHTLRKPSVADFLIISEARIMNLRGIFCVRLDQSHKQQALFLYPKLPRLLVPFGRAHHVHRL